jgi:hypothetical protein
MADALLATALEKKKGQKASYDGKGKLGIKL